MIILDNIKKSFGNTNVLNGIDLKIEQGDFIAIVGSSGSGKTTLLNILGYLDTPSSGHYFFNGKNVRSRIQRETIRNKHMGFVFQSYNLISKLTVYENIVLPVLYSLDHKKVKERLEYAEHLLMKYHLLHIKNSMAECISGGEKQRTCLARAVICDADLILSDEPTGNLDKINTVNVMNEFIELNRRGKTVIVVTHDEMVANVCKKKYILEGGHIEEYEG